MSSLPGVKGVRSLNFFSATDSAVSEPSLSDTSTLKVIVDSFTFEIKILSEN